MLGSMHRIRFHPKSSVSNRRKTHGLVWKAWTCKKDHGLVVRTQDFPTVSFDLAVGLDAPIQALYLGLLLTFLGGGSYLIVRQVLLRRELENAAKELGERVRTSQATAEEYFELGAVLLRKKLYSQAVRNLEKAKSMWEGETEELAQLHNALGYAYSQDMSLDRAVQEYRQAVNLQPGYVTAWNNLGDALEQKKDYRGALEAFEEALAYSPDNKVAKQKSEQLLQRIERLRL